MFHLVTGGSGSGKSAYAESVICRYQNKKGKLLYIATMIPFGEETKQKIKRHREMRKDKGFSTVECYSDLEERFRKQDILFRGEAAMTGILLECMSNLVANEIYGQGKGCQGAAERILKDISYLKENCANLVVVTNEVCSEEDNGSKEMHDYKAVLSEVNCKMAVMAERVTEVVYGIPISLKENEGKDRIMDGKEKSRQLKLIIGGCHQGKRTFAEKQYGKINWVDGRICELDKIYSCEGLYHFEAYICRLLECKSESQEAVDVERLVQQIEKRNPAMIVVTQEIGYGIVPTDPDQRECREYTGRICTRLASSAAEVYRVVCGIGMKLKEEKTYERDRTGTGIAERD